MPKPTCQSMCYVPQTINMRIRRTQSSTSVILDTLTKQGDSNAGRGSILTHESHGPARVIPEVQSSSSSMNQGQPTAGYFLDESLGREVRSSEGESGSARSMATVPGSQWCSGTDQGCWPELKAAAELLVHPLQVTCAMLPEIQKVKSSLHRNQDVNQRLAVHTQFFKLDAASHGLGSRMICQPDSSGKRCVKGAYSQPLLLCLPSLQAPTVLLGVFLCFNKGEKNMEKQSS